MGGVWWAALPAILIAVGVVLAPGWLVATAARIRGLGSLAVAGPVTVALAGVGAIVSSWTGLPFGWWTLAAAAVAVAAVAAIVVRAIAARRPGRPVPLGRWHRSLILPVAAMVLSGVVIAVSAFAATPGPDSFSQSYDGVFHLNAAASVLHGGSGSSLELYRLTHPGDGFEFYPAGWHDLVAIVAGLAGARVPLATNAVWIAVAGAIWVPGIVWLTDVVLGRRAARGARPASRTLLLVAAAALASAFAAFPALLLDWGTLYPTFLAYALLPAGLAATIRVFEPEADRVRPILVLLAWFAAAVVAHPRSLPSYAVLVVPYLVALLGGAIGRAWRDPARRRRMLALLAAAATVLVLAVVGAVLYVVRSYDVANRPIADHLNGGPATAHQDVWASLAQAIGLGPVVSPSEAALPASWLLAALVLVAVVRALSTPGLRWLGVVFGAIVVLYCFAAGTNSDLAKILTGLWYKDKYRLMAMLPVAAIPLAAWTAASGVEWVRARLRGVLGTAVAAVAALGVLLSAWAGPTAQGMTAAIGTVFALPPASDRNGALVDQDLYRVLRALPDELPADAIVVGNPWNGSGLSWAIGDRESLFPHLAGDWDPDRLTVAGRLDQALTDPEVCAALDRLGARYLVASDGLLWGGDPAAAQYAGIDRALAVPGLLEEIDRQGTAALYRIAACDR